MQILSSLPKLSQTWVERPWAGAKPKPRRKTKIISEAYMRKWRYLALISLAVLIAMTVPAWAQSTISTGSIQGTVTDPHDAVVPGASVTITSKATGQTIKATTSGSGTFSSGALQPSAYEVRVEASGFQT